MCRRLMFWQNSNMSAKLDGPIWAAISLAFIPTGSGHVLTKRSTNTAAASRDGSGMSIRSWKRRQTARSSSSAWLVAATTTT